MSAAVSKGCWRDERDAGCPRVSAECPTACLGNPKKFCCSRENERRAHAQSSAKQCSSSTRRPARSAKWKERLTPARRGRGTMRPAIHPTTSVARSACRTSGFHCLQKNAAIESVQLSIRSRRSAHYFGSRDPLSREPDVLTRVT